MIWLDVQLSPELAPWIAITFGETCLAVKDVGLRDAEDILIFQKAREAEVVVMTKDRDFVELLHRLGPPPQVVWLTCGNTSNAYLKKILMEHLPSVLNLLATDAPLVEIR